MPQVSRGADETGFRMVKPRMQKDTPSRRRREARRLAERIDKFARERQRAWTETGQAARTERLSVELNGPEHVMRPEGLYAELRGQRTEHGR